MIDRLNELPVMRFTIFSFATLMVLSVSQNTLAVDKPPEWSYAKLTAKADVIAIIEVKTSGNAKRPVVGDPILKLLGVELVTEAKPLAIFRGPKDIKKVMLRHFKKKPRLALTPSPRFMKLTKKRRYLVFLKKLKDGYFMPASGQFTSVHSAKPVP